MAKTKRDQVPLRIDADLHDYFKLQGEHEDRSVGKQINRVLRDSMRASKKGNIAEVHGIPQAVVNDVANLKADSERAMRSVPASKSKKKAPKVEPIIGMTPAPITGMVAPPIEGMTLAPVVAPSFDELSLDELDAPAPATPVNSMPAEKACCSKASPCQHWSWDGVAEVWVNSISGRTKTNE